MLIVIIIIIIKLVLDIWKSRKYFQLKKTKSAILIS